MKQTIQKFVGLSRLLGNELNIKYENLNGSIYQLFHNSNSLNTLLHRYDQVSWFSKLKLITLYKSERN